MNTCQAVPWEGLSQSARTSVVWWIRRLANGADSRITFHCHQGGVRSVTEEIVVQKNADGSRQIRVRTYQPQELSENGDA